MSPQDFRTLRKGAGLTQTELADAIGMTRETVGAMERGRAPIEKRTVLATLYVCQDAIDERQRFLLVAASK